MKKPIAAHIVTILAIAAIASSLTTFFHEGVHALSCPLVGGQLKEFSALHVDCTTTTTFQAKIVAGSASIANFVMGFFSFWFLNRTAPRKFRLRYFLWLFMLMNWLMGAGYWMFSGIGNIGDWANVIEGWQPNVLWRIAMTVIGTMSYMAFVWYALRIFGQIVGGQNEQEQVRRANRLTIPSYFAALAVSIISGLFNPHGVFGLPAVAGFFATAGGYAALLWMMQWFSAKNFKKQTGEALVISYSLTWILAAVVIVVFYAVVLGMGLRFNK